MNINFKPNLQREADGYDYPRVSYKETYTHKEDTKDEEIDYHLEYLKAQSDHGIIFLAGFIIGIIFTIIASILT